MTVDVKSGEFINGGIEFLIFDAIAKKLGWEYGMDINDSQL